MYRDAALKINYYKTQIMQELTKRGIYPDDITVQSRVNNIDDRLAVFQYMESQPGTEFDTEKFNTDMERVGQDLKFLYQLVYTMAIKEYVQLKSYVDCHLSELEDLAKKYSYKTKLEIGSTALGKTILYQANGYNLKLQDTWATVSLGSVTVNKGSHLACIFDADNILPENVIFSFDGSNCSPYSYNRDFFKVPGEAKSIARSYDLPEGSLITSAFPINIIDFKPTANSQYVIFGGKDKISYNDGTNEVQYVNKQQGNPCTLRSSGRIEFYVYGGSFISFDFSKQPIGKNFSDTSINNLKKRHKIVIECDADFSFDFVTDGQIYAVRQDGIIKNNKLYFPSAVQLYDFFVEEFLPGETLTYKNVTVTISGIGSEAVDINAIAIKELSALEVMAE